MGRASVDSSHSSSSSSGTLEKEDIQKPDKNGVVDVKEKVIEKEAIKKQMEQRRRKTSASRERIPEEKSSVDDRESRRHGKSAEDKITPRRVHSAGPSRPKNDEVMCISTKYLYPHYTRFFFLNHPSPRNSKFAMRLHPPTTQEFSKVFCGRGRDFFWSYTINNNIQQCTINLHLYFEKKVI